MPKTCDYCKATNPDDALFCAECGATLPSSDPIKKDKTSPSPSHSISERRIWKNVCRTISSIIILGGLVFSISAGISNLASRHPQSKDTSQHQSKQPEFSAEAIEWVLVEFINRYPETSDEEIEFWTKQRIEKILLEYTTFNQSQRTDATKYKSRREDIKLLKDMTSCYSKIKAK